MSRVTGFPDDEESPPEGQAEAEGSREPDEAGGGRSISLPQLGWIKRVGSFYQDVKMELRKTSWPDRTAVWNTTLVVLIAIVFFGFYLWGVDRLVTIGFEWLEKAVR
jgi:preprotein translocase subunit SecE